MSKLIKKLPAAIIVSILLTFSTSGTAHHSFSLFDTQTEKTLKGTVVEFQWTNPHTWTWVNVVNEKGEMEQWGLEGMSPNYLGRRGWSKNTLKPGDEVTLVIYPLKGGKKGGTLLRVTLPTGETMINFGNPGGRPRPSTPAR